MKKATGILVFLIIIIVGINSQGVTSNAIMLETFYQYDNLLGVSFDKSDNFEKGSEKELFRNERITEQYLEYTNEKLDFIKAFFTENATQYNKFFKLVLGDRPLLRGKPNLILKKEKYPDIASEFEVISDGLKNAFFTFPECVRIMWSYEREQIFVIGREISDGVFAITGEWPDFDLVYWEGFYFDGDYAPNNSTEYLINGVVKYPFWFYETNLKIRIVYQLKDPEGNYLGEFAVDFYKFDDYDKLFPDLQNK